MSIAAPLVTIGSSDSPGEIMITGTKITLSAKGGSIVIDSAGVTIQGTLAHIN